MLTITTGKVYDKAKWQAEGWLALDVTVKSAKGHTRSLAPTWDMVMGYKRGTMSEEEYTKRYMAILKRSQHEDRARWERTCRNHEKIVFLCFCPTGDFCHRHLLAKEFFSFAMQLGLSVFLQPEEGNNPRPAGKKSIKQKTPESGNDCAKDGRIEPSAQKEISNRAMTACYAGIGSRETPPEVLEEMKKIAKHLNEKGWILRSGGAKGADSAFEAGAGRKKQIFRPEECPPWCLEEVSKYMPEGRNLSRMKGYVQRLLGRNMMQVLGSTGKSPVEFVVCWTPLGKDDGGTGYAVRCALAYGIPVYNLKNEADRKAFYQKYV